MATSGSKSVTVTSWDTLKFSWSESSQSVANNTTTISWKMELVAGSSGRISSTVSKDWSVTVNGTKYSGTNTVGISNNATKTLASGSTTINHNSDGTKTFSYSFSQEFGITFSGSSIGTKSGSGTGTLDTIPRQAVINSAPNFNDEQNPAITYTNSAGNNVTSLQACIADSNGSTIYVQYRDISKTGTSYTFTLTDAERTVLRKACVNAKSMTVKFYVKTVIGGNTYYSSLAKTLTITNANPTMNPVLSITTDSTTYNLTGSTSKFIKNYTYVNYAFNASALKNATIKSYKVTCGDLLGAASSGRLEGGITTPNVVFTVTDSRGYTTTKTVTANLVDYVRLTCSLNADINTSGEIKGTISGKYFNGSFGATTNTLSVMFRYKKSTDTNYSVWINTTATKTDNTYTAPISITGLDYKSKYQIQAQAVDKIITIGTNEITLSCIPVFDWGENDFNFNVPVTYTESSSKFNLVGAAKALTNSYTLTTSIAKGDNYSTVTASNAVLLGNNLRCHLSAVRSSSVAAGNITNEKVATYTIKHDGKIKAAYANGIVNGATGGVASFALLNQANDGSYLTFDVNLAATATAGTEFSTYFTIPCTLHLDAY